MKYNISVLILSKYFQKCVPITCSMCYEISGCIVALALVLMSRDEFWIRTLAVILRQYVCGRS